MHSGKIGCSNMENSLCSFSLYHLILDLEVLRTHCNPALRLQFHNRQRRMWYNIWTMSAKWVIWQKNCLQDKDICAVKECYIGLRQIQTSRSERNTVLPLICIRVRSLTQNSHVSVKFYVNTLNNTGDRGGTVVKVLCYKSEGRWFDPIWCHWNMSLT